MTTLEANKALVRQFYADIDAGNLAAMDELVAEDYLDHDRAIPDLPPGREGLKMAFQIFAQATPGTHEILEQVAEGDLVVTQLRARGTFAADLGDVPATGGDMDVTATAVHRISDGRLAEHWGEVDSLRLMQQLGVVPTDPAP